MRYRVIANYDGRKREDVVVAPNLEMAEYEAERISAYLGALRRADSWGKTIWTYGKITLVDENLRRTLLRHTLPRPVQSFNDRMAEIRGRR